MFLKALKIDFGSLDNHTLIPTTALVIGEHGLEGLLDAIMEPFLDKGSFHIVQLIRTEKLLKLFQKVADVIAKAIRALIVSYLHR